MKRIVMLTASCVLLSAHSALAAPTAKAAPAQTPAAAAVVDEQAQSDVVGSKEAPGVFNIVPWKEKGLKPEKKEVSTSILRETLQPLDRDILRREIEFHRNATQQ